jgi:hypothetical protein
MTMKSQPNCCNGEEPVSEPAKEESEGLQAARESFWLNEVRRGYSIRLIARNEALAERRIQVGVGRARLREELSRIKELEIREILHKQATATPSHAQPLCAEHRRQIPSLLPLFPIGAFTPQSTCGHRGPIRPGSLFCCMVCFQSGMDGHPSLERDPRNEPRPEPKPDQKLLKPVLTEARETRRERRKRLHEAKPGATEARTAR